MVWHGIANDIGFDWRLGYDFFLDEILNLMTKSLTFVGRVSNLLMESAILRTVEPMRWRIGHGDGSYWPEEILDHEPFQYN